MKKIVNDILKWVASLVTLEVIGMFFLDALISTMLTAFIPVKFLVVFFLIFSGYVYYKLRNNEKTKKLAKIIGTVIICFVIFFGTTATFPEVSRVLPWGIKKVSITVAKFIVNPSKVKDEMVADAIKDSIVEAHSSNFEKAYKLNPEKAVRDRDSIRDKYDFDKVKKRIEARKDSIANIQDNINASKINHEAEKLSENNSKVGGQYNVGNHRLSLKKGEESDWLEIEKCHNYDFFPGKQYVFTLYYEDGEVVNSWEGRPWLSQRRFKVLNLCDEMPVLKVI